MTTELGIKAFNMYKSIPYYCEFIDKQILDCSTFKNNLFCETSMILNKIIELSEIKKRFLNLKIVIDDVLSNMPLEKSHFLIMRYLDNVSISDTIKCSKIIERTLYRKIVSSLKTFSSNLKRRGIDENFLESLKIEGDQR